MRKSFLKAAIPTMAMLLVAVMALTGTTYAWFTQTKTATVGQVKIKVETNSSMKVAVVAKNATQTSGWTNNLALTTISGSEGANFPENYGSAWKAVSSQTGKGGSFYTVEIDPTNSANIVSSATNTTNYIKFEVYLWNDSDTSKQVDLAGSTYSTDNDVYKAVRVSVVDMGTAKSDFTSGTSIAKYTGTEGSAVIWEPAGASSTRAIKGTFTGSVTADNSDYTGVQSTQADAGNVGVTVAAHAVEKVAVYFWLEGQDVDCVNAITGKEMTLDLIFDGQ